MKKAIANYINAKAEAIRLKSRAAMPCEHKWKLLNMAEVGSKINPNFFWKEYTYMCEKCGERNFISTQKD
uniref:Uncharacterized protein n=1 Tax=viral metagenome TaxID=1070528 RepID=A0A6M3JXJ7_9ZZZZ